MEISKNLHQGTYYVRLSGKFTFNDHPGFREILNMIADENIRQIIFQLSELEFVDSAALGMLLLALDETGKYHKTLVLNGANGQVRKMFNLARFDSMFTMN